MLRYRNASYTDQSQTILWDYKGTEELFLLGARSFLEVLDCHCSFIVSALQVVWKATSFTPNPPSMSVRHWPHCSRGDTQRERLLRGGCEMHTHKKKQIEKEL